MPVSAQEHTSGLFVYEVESFDGYTLFCPGKSTTTYLIDNYGRVVHTWESDYFPNNSVYLLENGNLLRPCKFPGGGAIEEIAWDGSVVWFYENNGAGDEQHHDIEPMPNGNVLALIREDKTGAEAVAAGRNPALLNNDALTPEYIAEIQPDGPTGGNVVWEWHFWDHLIQDFDPGQGNHGVVADHPELVDINFMKHARADWIHANAVEYNPVLDQIVICSYNLCEIYVIDHSTTTHEASSHSGGLRGVGGDILYRWGNPQAYRAGSGSDKKFFGQHDAQWIPPGYPGESNILVYNNGINRPGLEYSTVDEIIAPVDENGDYPQPSSGAPHGPTEQEWIYAADPPESFYSGIISGAHRLSNGNTVVCCGIEGRFFEVTPEGGVVWEYINPATEFGPAVQGEEISYRSNTVFRCTRYAPDYPGLDGRDLTPGGYIEIYPVKVAGTSHSPEEPTVQDSIIVIATITDISGIASAELYVNTGSGFTAANMFDDGLHHDGLAGDDVYGAVIAPLPGGTSVQYYIQAEDGEGSTVNDPPLAPSISFGFEVSGGGDIPCGDANGDNLINVGDVVFIINYVFRGGPPPDPICSGDANGDGEANVGDGVFQLNFIFNGGPTPDPDCCL
jgi:hypothetical protein